MIVAAESTGSKGRQAAAFHTAPHPKTLPCTVDELIPHSTPPLPPSSPGYISSSLSVYPLFLHQLVPPGALSPLKDHLSEAQPFSLRYLELSLLGVRGMLVIMSLPSALMGGAEDPVSLMMDISKRLSSSCLLEVLEMYSQLPTTWEWSAWAVLGTSEAPSSLPGPMKVPEFCTGPLGFQGL